MSKAKQVFIIRKDLKMNPGKVAAQVSHASTGILLKLMNEYKIPLINDLTFRTFHYKNSSPIGQWINGIFTKVCLKVNSEQELLDIYEQAKKANLLNILITDSGLTCFNNIPTNTVVGLGPNSDQEIDAITGHLKLYR